MTEDQPTLQYHNQLSIETISKTPYLEHIGLNTPNSAKWTFKIWESESRTSDRYIYTSPKGGTYTHPTLAGARGRIRQDLIDLGIINVPIDNSHLSADNLAAVNQYRIARNSALTFKPTLGDYILIKGEKQRVAFLHEYGAQTCTGGSFNIKGTCSASLNESLLYESFALTQTTEPAIFWMIDKDQPEFPKQTAIHFNLLVNVWEYEPRPFTDAQARAHPICKIYESHYSHLSPEAITHDLRPIIAAIQQGYGS